MLLLSPNIYAQAPDTLRAAKVLAVKELPVVKPAESVRLDQVVTPPLQVADAIRRFTGVQVKDYGGVGGLKTVNVRSLGSEHVGIFLDGIQVDNAQNMQVDLGRFDTENLSAISLFTGQKSRRLQTAKEYASGAAVYLESEAPERTGGHVRLQGGAFGTLNPSARWELRRGRFALRASASFLTSNGRYKYPYFDTTLVRENGDITALRLETQVFGRLKGGEWRVHLYSYGSERGFPGPVIRRASGFPFSAERQADQDLFVQGSWTQEWTSRYSWALRVKYANNYTHYNTHPERNPMALPYNLHYRQQQGYASLAQSLVLASPWSVDLSTDLQYNALDSDMGQFVTPRRTTFTGALATRLVWQKFRAAAHLTYQGAWDCYLTPEAGGWSRENGYRDAWMPSLSLFWAPLKWLEIDAFARESYRLPSFNDLYYALVGNASLEPEKATQLGADLRVHHGPFELRISPYYNRVSNKIVAIPTASQFRWTMLNVGLADILGLDAKASASWTLGSVALEAVLRYTFQQAMDHSTPGGLTYGNQLPYIPRHSGGIDLGARWKAWALAWNTVFTGVRWSRSANTADYYIQPWSTTDLAISRQFWHLKLGLSCNNLFNCRYQIVQGYPMPGVNFLFSAEYRW